MKERKPNRLKGYDYSQGGGYFVTISTKYRDNHFGEINKGEMILNDCGKIAYEMFKGIENIHKNIVLDKYVVMPNHIHGIIIITDPIVGDAYSIPQNKNLQGKYSVNLSLNLSSKNMRPVQKLLINKNTYIIVGDAYSMPQNKNLQGKYSDKITINSSSSNMRPLPDNNYDYDRSKMLLSKVIQLYKSAVMKQIKRRSTKPNSTIPSIWQRSFHDHIIRNEKSYNNIWEYIHYNPLKWEWDIENRLNKTPDKNYYSKLFIC